MRFKALTIFLILAAGPAHLAGPAHAAGADGLDGFDAFVEEIMAEWLVPGLAVAVVKDGEVLLCRAYGLRAPDLDEAVTTKTLFAVGSVTKTLTATGLALLVEEGRLDWDRPVRDYMPDFALMDPEASRRITPRHLVSHRSGLPRHDVLWYAEAFDRAEMFRRLRHLKPTKRLGQTFQYQNLMFMAAGMLAGRLDGGSWEAFTRKRLLEPLGMTATRLSLGEFLLTPNIALPYFPGDEGRVPIDPRDTDQIGPASAVYSNIEDMARYLRFHLADGRAAGRPLLSQAGARSLRQIAVPFAKPRKPRAYYTEGYGLGFYIASYRGRRMARHGGAIDGYLSWFSFMPEEQLGVVVLSNLSGGNPVPRLVTLNLYDRLLGLEPMAWAAWRREADRKAEAKAAAKPPEEPPHEQRPPALDLAAYEGRYEHPAYGVIGITVETERLFGRFNHIAFPLEHFDRETWRLPETVWPLREGLELSFQGDGKGQVDRLVTPIADGPSYRHNPGDMVFRRTAPAD